MGGSSSKSQSESPEPPEIRNVIQDPTPSCSTHEDDFSIIEKLDKEW